MMTGHSFGLISAVYNYNRRSAMLDEILQKAFEVASNFYYDDKFGIETMETINSADEAVIFLHTILGCDWVDRKHYVGKEPTILGITYNLVAMHLEIEESRKKDL